PPDDALLAAVLEKLFADRQVTIPDTLIPYLLPRMERSLAAAQALVARLDREALARGRPIGRSLAAELLGAA
ncbi:MAG: chromosomal replication initiator DnaA, partial [Rhodobacteraceae bacterium]|nr:chromosomal replication initiator DnaA [Paracoccaceae bacterium]